LNAPALEAIGVSKRYGRQTWALRHIDVSIGAGRITALVGPNAAGKSTLMKTWVGFERPTTGRAIVDGQDPWHSRTSVLEKIAYLPQSPSLYRDLTIEDHFGIAKHFRPNFDELAARRWLDDLRISPRSRPKELSGGQVAQVGLSIVLGSRVPILLLDEPLASLDPLARHEFLEVLRSAAQPEGRTVVLSSHVVGDISQVCDWIVVLGAGMKSLDCSISEALAGHRVLGPSDRPVDADQLVGPLPDGRRVVMSREPVESSEASLEEIVLAYLARGRRDAGSMTARE
jgi:ABC-2 type transport system ATP-binding protein